MSIRFAASLLLATSLLQLQLPVASAQAQTAGQNLTLDDVVSYVQSGLSEELIIVRVKRNNKPFDLSPAEIGELKQLGFTDTVLKYLIDPSQPYSPPAPPQAASQAAPTGASFTGPSNAAPIAPPPSAAKPPSDPLVLKLPPEAGLYWLVDGQPVQLELKPIVASKQGGGKIKSLIKKSHIVGSVAGVAAKAALPVGTKTLYARLQTPVEDLVLVQLESEEGRRDLDFGTKAAKPTFPPGSVKQFESKDVGLGVVRFTLPDLAPSQYLFFILGSGEEKKGTLGKGWEFGVQ
jgi:hypothetical protein